MRRAVAVALVAGVVVGTFLAALPYAGNELCSGAQFADEARGGADSRVGGWPYGTRCDWALGGEEARAFAPSVPEALAWVVLASLLFAAALLRRSAAARGAAAAATLLAVTGGLWQFGGEFAPAGMFALILGPAVVYAVLRRAVTAVALSCGVLVVWVVPAFLGWDYLAIAAGLAAGAGIAAFPRPAPAVVPAR